MKLDDVVNDLNQVLGIEGRTTTRRRVALFFLPSLMIGSYIRIWIDKYQVEINPIFFRMR